MKLKFGPKEIDLRRVRNIQKVGHNLAKMVFHTGEAILVRCSVRRPDGFTCSYLGTVEELKALISGRYKNQTLASRSDCIHE